MDEERRNELAPEQTSFVLMIVGCIAHYFICVTLTSDIALDVDPINLLAGMREYNLAHFAPHPPGYLVYVWMLRGLHGIVGGDRFETLQLLARLLSTATIPLVYLAVRKLRRADPGAAAFAALLTAFHPFLIFHAVDAQTHTSEAFAAALLLVAVVAYRDRPSVARAAAAGAVLALGSAFRPTFVVAGIGPIVWAIGFRRFRHLCVAGFVSVVGALAWVLPTAHLSGGFAQWRKAQSLLISQVFVRTSSPFSDEAIPDFVLLNAASTTYWFVLALAPALIGPAARRWASEEPDVGYQRARSIALWSAAPSVVFYASMFCSEPGYLLGFVPALIAFTALSLTPDLSGRVRRITFTLAGAVQLATLMLPAGGRYIAKSPSIPELVQREVLYRTVLDRMAARMPEDARILYVTDYPDVVLSRQLPEWNPSMHSLIVHSEYWPGFEETSIAFATPDDCLPIPGPILLEGGPPTIVDLPYHYDYVVIDPVSSSDLRAELREHTRCDVGSAEGVVDITVLPAAECFPDGLIEVHGHGVRFH